MVVSVFSKRIGIIWYNFLGDSQFQTYVMDNVEIVHSCYVFTQHANSLLLLIHVQVQYDLAITRNTCVNVCSLNCLNLFLKYKIG